MDTEVDISWTTYLSVIESEAIWNVQECVLGTLSYLGGKLG
jgi:hypothetical protein